MEYDEDQTIREIESSPDFSKEWLDLWSSPLIYLLFQKNTIVYIGQTKNGLPRIIEHYLKSKKEFTHFKILPCPLSSLNKIEAELIASFLPKYNFILPKNSIWLPREQAKEIIKEIKIFDSFNRVLRTNPWISKIELNGRVYYKKSDLLYIIKVLSKIKIEHTMDLVVQEP